MGVAHHWVIWAYPQGSEVGREFGVDYRSLEEAQQARRAYAAYWPNTRYIVRRRKGPALATRKGKR